MERPEIFNSMLEKPEMLEEMDYLFKDDTARRLLFYHQVWTQKFKLQLFKPFEQGEELDTDDVDIIEDKKYRNDRNISVMQRLDEPRCEGTQLN